MPITSFGVSIGVNFDVAGGSSGSGVFDAAGNIVGVLSNGGGCSLSYSAMQTMMSDPIVIPNPPTERAVMLVFDRSGSMSESAGDGKVKINEARAAAELFVNMVRTTGNRAGLISFSTDATNPVDFALAPVTSSSKSQINGKLAAISPNGATSIGDGLTVARDQLAGATSLPCSILLLTDGMEKRAEENRRCCGPWPDRNNRHRLRCRRQSRRRQAQRARPVTWRPLQAGWGWARTEEVLCARVR
jgi:hypothetical protein